LRETEKMNNMFDPEEVLEQIGGDKELLMDLIQIFIDTYPEDLKALHESVLEGDPETIRKNAHRVKGSVSNFGKHKAFHTAKSIEDLAKEGDLTEIPRMCNELVDHLLSLEKEIKRYQEVNS